ncbi:SCO family protein [Halobacteriovorax sp. GFR7]|uniref:SCO family protein n=1 Tax=unclassified Halobacteriovorax TaxID=2639665 RepID=UPI003D952464
MTSLGIKRSNSLIETLVSKKAFWLVFVLYFFSVPFLKSVFRELPPELPVVKELPAFSLTNSFGKTFGSKELEGRVYIANFIFTNCPSSCLRLTAEMQKIQKRVRGLGQKVALVSFTVDPETDNPKTLFKYARKHQANPYIWTFLTGKTEDMQATIIDGFGTEMGKMQEVEANVNGETVTMFDIAHSEKLVLVDGHGKIRGYYDSTSKDINKLMIDLGLLVNKEQYLKN